ncbi:hypothetical protein ACEQ8H_001287 [Pleosporales sp. CAS-2024a]
MYLASVALTKISILLFYLRIFPQKGLRKVIWVTIVICILYMIGFVTATAFQCLPIRNAWERWDGEHPGRCFNLNADAWASAAVNIFLDLLVVILPMRQISKLAMSTRRKLGVMLMFLGGLFVTIVSMLRLRYLVNYAHTDNVTWDYLPVGYWSAVEAHVGVMVACLPAMRALEHSIRERIWPKPASKTDYYEDGTKDSSANKTKKSSHRNSHSRILNSLTRSQVDKEDFVRLDEYEMQTKESKDGMRSPSPTASDRSPSRSFKSHEDALPLAEAGAPLGGIMVHSEYSVDRGSALAQTTAMNRTDTEELQDRLRCNV